ncbi:MAG TPA: histidine phosphatase family protein [Candidatus Paceibacterota bacterium]
MATRICFIRHGETAWNAEKRIQGQTDIPLNEHGRDQARMMAANAAQYAFSAICSSDLQRAVETAQCLAAGRGLNVHTTPLLRERHFGEFQGLTGAEAAARDPAAYARYKARDLDYDFATGESLQQLATRVQAAVAQLLAQYPGQTIAVVCHAGVLDVLYRLATNRPLHTPRNFDLPNCALNWFRFDAQGWHLEAWDDHHYLPSVQLESVE